MPIYYTPMEAYDLFDRKNMSVLESFILVGGLEKKKLNSQTKLRSVYVLKRLRDKIRERE